MAKIECKEGSGRTYTVKLSNAILREMSPSVTTGVAPSLVQKMMRYGMNKGVTGVDAAQAGEMMQELELDPEEWEQLEKSMESDNGPEMLKYCLLFVDGVPPADVIDPDTDKPYGTVEAFIDDDEALVDDLPEIMDVVVDKLTRFYSGVVKKGELRLSSRTSAGKKKA